jgi:hypothetical protein
MQAARSSITYWLEVRLQQPNQLFYLDCYRITAAHLLSRCLEVS